MKTSEFKKRLGELQYVVCEDGRFLDVKTLFGKHCARICIVSDLVQLNTASLELAKLCIEYAETPISEREDEKKYIVIIPDPESEGSRFALARTVNETIVINVAKKSNIETLKRYRLTESEIKRNHEYLWQFAKEVQE